MALLRRSGSRFTTNIWPGFVDAMTALLLVLMFVLSIFMIIQSVFREKISGQETELSKLENEVLDLIADLSLQKEEYKNLNAMNVDVGYNHSKTSGRRCGISAKETCTKNPVVQLTLDVENTKNGLAQLKTVRTWLQDVLISTVTNASK